MSVIQRPAAETPPGLGARLSRSRVGLRPELQFTRHLFRGKVAYVVRDPITFGSHSLGHEDYEILIRIQPQRTLGEIFQALVEEGLLGVDDEERFFEFVVSLHSLGFLSLQISDSNRLYRRFLAKQRRKRQGRWLSVLFLQIPLLNPDAFLTRTASAARFVFTRGFFACWLALVGVAGAVLCARWGEFQAGFADLFATRNLLTLWGSLIALKLFHELGHGYACKTFGGQVPEAGVYLIALTPCAYVDASASWGFHRKLHRVVVGLAGMYFELTIAALALLAWSVAEPGLLQAWMHNLVVLASVVTIGFNINPLMRYDGYYVLSDLLELPNLRARGERAVASVAKRLMLGIRPASDTETAGVRVVLFTFGVLSSLYRVVVILSIAALVATKFFLAGLVLGGAYVGMSLVQLLRKTLAYLWWADETQPVRVRAVALSIVVLGGGSALLFLAPAPTRVHADAVVARAAEATLRAEQPGILAELPARRGLVVSTGTRLATLSNPAPLREQSTLRARLAASELRVRALEFLDPLAAREEAARAQHLREQLAHVARTLEQLAPSAPMDGEILDCLPSARVGSYVQRGEVVARVGSGSLVIETLLSERQLGQTHLLPGERVEFRSPATPHVAWPATIVRVEPAGSRDVGAVALTQAGGGAILTDPNTQQATRDYFRVVAELEVDAPAAARVGLTGVMRLKGHGEPLGLSLYRKLLVFLHRLEAR